MIFLVLFALTGIGGIILFITSILHGSTNDFLRNDKRQKQVVWLILLSFLLFTSSFCFLVTFIIDFLVKMM